MNVAQLVGYGRRSAHSAEQFMGIMILGGRELFLLSRVLSLFTFFSSVRATPLLQLDLLLLFRPDESIHEIHSHGEWAEMRNWEGFQADVLLQLHRTLLFWYVVFRMRIFSHLIDHYDLGDFYLPE